MEDIKMKEFKYVVGYQLLGKYYKTEQGNIKGLDLGISTSFTSVPRRQKN